MVEGKLLLFDGHNQVMVVNNYCTMAIVQQEYDDIDQMTVFGWQHPSDDAFMAMVLPWHSNGYGLFMVEKWSFGDDHRW